MNKRNSKKSNSDKLADIDSIQTQATNVFTNSKKGNTFKTYRMTEHKKKLEEHLSDSSSAVKRSAERAIRTIDGHTRELANFKRERKNKEKEKKSPQRESNRGRELVNE